VQLAVRQRGVRAEAEPPSVDVTLQPIAKRVVPVHVNLVDSLPIGYELSEAPSALDLVKAGKDVIVLRTFSKVYGMAGLRCGFVIARPDVLEKVVARGGQNFMPTTAVTAAVASLKDTTLVPERRRINAGVRQQIGKGGDLPSPTRSTPKRCACSARGGSDTGRISTPATTCRAQTRFRGSASCARRGASAA